MGNSIPVYSIYEGETFFPLAEQRTSWKEALLAALPHLWIGLSVALTLFHFGASAAWLTDVGIYSRVAFFVFSLALLAYAWYRGWPLWSASWYFYALWLGIIILSSSMNRLSPQASALTPMLVLGSLAAMAVIYLFIDRASPLHALLAGLFLMPVATQFDLEAIPDNLEAAIALLFAVLAAAAAVGIIRIQNWTVGAVLALLANLIAGMALTYVCYYRAEIPGFYGDTFFEAALAFAFYFALAIALFIGPLIFWILVDLFRSRRMRRRERLQGGVH